MLEQAGICCVWQQLVTEHFLASLKRCIFAGGPLYYAFKGILFSGCLYVRNHILKACEHSIFQTACGNFTKFTT